MLSAFTPFLTDPPNPSTVQSTKLSDSKGCQQTSLVTGKARCPHNMRRGEKPSTDHTQTLPSLQTAVSLGRRSPGDTAGAQLPLLTRL